MSPHEPSNPEPGANMQEARPRNPEDQGAARPEVRRPRSESFDGSHGGLVHPELAYMCSAPDLNHQHSQAHGIGRDLLLAGCGDGVYTHRDVVA